MKKLTFFAFFAIFIVNFAYSQVVKVDKYDFIYLEEDYVYFYKQELAEYPGISFVINSSDETKVIPISIDKETIVLQQIIEYPSGLCKINEVELSSVDTTIIVSHENLSKLFDKFSTPIKLKRVGPLFFDDNGKDMKLYFYDLPDNFKLDFGYNNIMCYINLDGKWFDVYIGGDLKKEKPNTYLNKKFVSAIVVDHKEVKKSKWLKVFSKYDWSKQKKQ